MGQLSGEFILAEDIIPVRYFKKIATETITNSTLQDDDDIAGIVLAANKVYSVQFYGATVGGDAGTARDIKLAWVVTGGAAQLVSRVCIGPGVAATDVEAATTVRLSRHNLATAVAYGNDDGASASIYEAFLVETTTAGTAGTLTLQWAQNTTNATGSQLTTSTYCIVSEVEAG